MKRLSFIPGMLIWLTFSVVAGFGYAFSFFEYVKAGTQMSVTDIVIPTLVWVLLAAICTFLLRAAQRSQCFVYFSKGESLFLECSILALLLIGGTVFRFVDYFHGVWPVALDNTYFQYAQVSQITGSYQNPHPASRVYVGFLHMVCMFLGNLYEAGAFIQFVLLLAAVAVWYFAIRKALGIVTALFFVAGAMLLPDSISESMQCNPMMLLFLIYGCVALLLVQYVRAAKGGVLMYASEFLLGILAVWCAILDISGILLCVAFLLAMWYRYRDHRENVGISFIAACLGAVVGDRLFAYMQAWIYGISYREAREFQAYEQLSLHLPKMEEIRAFTFSLGTHPIFIVVIVVISIYWFLNKKQAFDWIMLSLLYLFGIQFFSLDSYLQHDFMIYMGISILFGISVQQYLQTKPKEKRKKEEPVVTVVHFEKEPAVTIPEKPAIFIPKTMEIPKRTAKPKVDFALDVQEEQMHFDYSVDETADFDV